MSAQSELRSPASSDSPILPAPRIAILMPQAYESGVVSRQQVHAREPGPLAVGLEEGVRLLRLDAPPPERGGQLDEAEIAREPALVAAEPLEADDADRPGPEPALALEPPRDGVGRERLQRLEVGASGRAGRATRRAARRARGCAARRARSAPRSAQVGAAWRPPSSRVAARTTARSIARARLGE